MAVFFAVVKFVCYFRCKEMFSAFFFSSITWGKNRGTSDEGKNERICIVLLKSRQKNSFDDRCPRYVCANKRNNAGIVVREPPGHSRDNVAFVASSVVFGVILVVDLVVVVTVIRACYCAMVPVFVVVIVVVAVVLHIV